MVRFTLNTFFIHFSIITVLTLTTFRLFFSIYVVLLLIHFLLAFFWRLLAFIRSSAILFFAFVYHYLLFYLLPFTFYLLPFTFYLLPFTFYWNILFFLAKYKNIRLPFLHPLCFLLFFIFNSLFFDFNSLLYNLPPIRWYALF